MHLIPLFSALKLDAIATRDIQRYRGEIMTSHCPATANRHLSLLAKRFKLAVQWERVARNPCMGVKKFREDNQRERFLSADEIQRLYAAMAEEPNRVAVAALKLQLLTGLRKEDREPAHPRPAPQLRLAGSQRRGNPLPGPAPPGPCERPDHSALRPSCR